MSIAIRNARIITADQDFHADIYIENEKISEIGTDLSIQSDRIIDASGMYVIPGGIDVHTHMEALVGGTTSSDDFETGTRAAAFGGTTCIIDFATQSHGQKMRETLDIWWKKGEKAVVDYGLHMIVTDLPEAHLEDMNDIIREGVTSFKLFMAYPGVLMVDDATIFRVMQQSGKSGSMVCIHAENGGAIDVLVKQAIADGKKDPVYHALTRPAAAESEAVNRAIALASMADVPVYIVHVSTYDALERIAEARDRGLPVYGETCPHYLLLSIDELKRPDFEGAKYVLTPPLREQWHQEKLWGGLQRNTLQLVSTDHCPFCFKEQKTLGRDSFAKIPNGGPGVEDRLHLTYHHGVNKGRITLNRWVELISAAPAKMFGLYPRKGAIAVGSDADIVLWDPAKEHTISAMTHHMNVDYSMFEGFDVKGAAETVISRGEVIVENGKWLGKKGRGKYLKRDQYTGRV
jgi:dihydropyrimidinase